MRLTPRLGRVTAVAQGLTVAPAPRITTLPDRLNVVAYRSGYHQPSPLTLCAQWVGLQMQAAILSPSLRVVVESRGIRVSAFLHLLFRKVWTLRRSCRKRWHLSYVLANSGPIYAQTHNTLIMRIVRLFYIFGVPRCNQRGISIYISIHSATQAL